LTDFGAFVEFSVAMERLSTDAFRGALLLKTLVKQIRDNLLETQDSVCLERARLVTEAYRRYEGEPVPILRARAFAHVLGHMTLDLDSNPIFAGNTSSRPRGWMLVPEHGLSADAQVLIENDGLEGLLDGAVPEDILDFWRERSFGGNSGIGHLAVDLECVVRGGLESIIEEAEGVDGGESSSAPCGEGKIYRQGMVIALQAVVDWAQRYAEAAEQKSRKTDDPQLREVHMRVARACRRVPAKPARDLFEGLQAIALVHLAIAIEGHGMSVSPGLLDRVLGPLVDGEFDADEATDLVAAFMLKISANSLFGRGSKTQPISVGGADEQGRDQCNDLTLCFLDACDFVRVGDPHLFLRWHPGIDPVVLGRAADMLARGVSMPLLINDLPTAQGFVDAGCAPEDAWGYCVIGCNELGIPGLSAESATATSGMVQHLQVLNEILLDHPAREEIGGMGQLLSMMEDSLRQNLTQRRAGWRQRRQRIADNVPTPFTSALMDGCVARGEDMVMGMKYHLPGLYERGVTNGANALAAIEQLVFSERAMSLSELIGAMEGDFADREILNRLQGAPKWGNDDDRVDRWAVELVEMRERVLDDIDAEFGDPPHMVCHVVRSLHHMDGKRIGASPDGRHARTPVADSIGAQAGTASGGPTAILNSVLKIDAARYYRGGYNLNLTLPDQSTTPELVRALVDGFFDNNGQELQINCLDADRLREAQQYPEQHGDMVVRVAGFSARFVDLSVVEQNELIARAEVM